MRSTKHQAPRSREHPSTKLQNRAATADLDVGCWRLELLWMLVLGCWCFVATAQEIGGSANTNRSDRLANAIRRGPTAEVLLEKSDDWFRSEEGRRATTNVLSWQSPLGDWPSNTRTPTQPFDGDRARLRGNFDNGATTGELRFLARAFRATQDTNCETALLKGIDLILKAQYPTGGWPQSYPPDDQYHRHITFNDNAMVRLMNLVRDVATLPEFAFVDETRRKSTQSAFDRGVECILKCQIKVNGRLTVWCAQHDELDYSPRSGRKFELVSLSGSESAGILELLMSLDNPTPEIARAIHAGAGWFERSKISGIRFTRADGERVVSQDAAAPPLWARFYEIESNRPIFSGRDSVKKYSFAEIERERRNGYDWYGPWGEGVATAYSQWTKKWPKLAGG
jgi:PelA/Pel-15E family pectate lyase